MSDLNSHGHLIVKLYELRRDPEMRAARAWYVADFHPRHAQDIAALVVGGFDQSAKYRMVTSYWEMVAGLVNHGALDEALFLAANTEHVVIFAKIEPFLTELRALFQEADYLQELERLVQRIPEHKALVDRRRGLTARWGKQKQTRGRIPTMGQESRLLAGIVLVTVPSVMFGGFALLAHLAGRLHGYADNPLRHDLWRAGHAHAGVYLILSLVILKYVDEALLSPGWKWAARVATPIAALLIPAGFFLSVLSPDATQAGPLLALVYPGALSLAVGVVVTGVGLIRGARGGRRDTSLI